MRREEGGWKGRRGNVPWLSRQPRKLRLLRRRRQSPIEEEARKGGQLAFEGRREEKRTTLDLDASRSKPKTRTDSETHLNELSRLELRHILLLLLLGPLRPRLLSLVNRSMSSSRASFPSRALLRSSELDFYVSSAFHVVFLLADVVVRDLRSRKDTSFPRSEFLLELVGGAFAVELREEERRRVDVSVVISKRREGREGREGSLRREVLE